MSYYYKYMKYKQKYIELLDKLTKYRHLDPIGE